MFFDSWSNRLIILIFSTVFAIIAILITISLVLLALETNIWPPEDRVAAHDTWYTKVVGKKPLTDKDTSVGVEEFESGTESGQETSGKTKKEISNWMQQVMFKSRLKNDKKTTTTTTATTATATPAHESTSMAVDWEQARITRPQRSYTSLSGTTLVASPSEQSLASISRSSEEMVLPD